MLNVDLFSYLTEREYCLFFIVQSVCTKVCMLFFIHFPHFTGLLSITSITSHIVRLKSQVIDFCQRSRFSDFLSLFFSLLIILFFCFFLPVFCIGGFYILLLARTGVPLSSSSTFLSFGSSLFQACFRISDKKRNNNNQNKRKKANETTTTECKRTASLQ